MKGTQKKLYDLMLFSYQHRKIKEIVLENRQLSTILVYQVTILLCSFIYSIEVEDFLQVQVISKS